MREVRVSEVGGGKEIGRVRETVLLVVREKREKREKKEKRAEEGVQPRGCLHLFSK